jgi:hypothetical protein
LPEKSRFYLEYFEGDQLVSFLARLFDFCVNCVKIALEAAQMGSTLANFRLKIVKIFPKKKSKLMKKFEGASCSDDFIFIEILYHLFYALYCTVVDFLQKAELIITFEPVDRIR